MTQITSIVFTDAEAWLIENLKDFGVDNIACVYPVSDFDADWSRQYYDDEECITKVIPFSTHVEALEQLVNLIDAKKLYVGGLKAGVELADPCNWDIEVVDAYFQLLYHQEVIYG